MMKIINEMNIPSRMMTCFTNLTFNKIAREMDHFDKHALILVTSITHLYMFYIFLIIIVGLCD